MATAELALTMPAVVLVLTMLLFAGQVVVGELRCVDAARAAARLAARGDSSASVLAQAARLAPPGAVLSVDRAGDQVRAVVRASVGGLFPAIPAITVSGTGSALAEGSP